MGKKFIYHSKSSVKEGLDTESPKPYIYDKEKSQKCSLCSQLFIIGKNLNKNPRTCNECHKIVSAVDNDGEMGVFWKNNAKYHVFSNLWQSFIDSILRQEEMLDKFGSIYMNKYDCRFDAREEVNRVAERHPLDHVNESWQHRTHAVYNH